MKPVRLALLLALSLVLTTTLVRADNVSELPDSWQKQLLEVTRPNLSRLTPEESKRAEELRSRLSNKLERQNPDESDEEPGSLYGELGKVYQVLNLQTQAERCYQNANRLQPDEFRWAYYLAYLSQKNGDLQTALERYREADRIKPDYTPLNYRVADIFLDLDQIDAAEPLFTEILQEDEFADAAHYGLGQIELFRRNYEKAIPHLEQALKLQPEAKQLHYPLGQAYRATGRLEEARQQFSLHEDIDLIVYDPLIHELGALRSPSKMLFLDAMDAVHRRDYAAAADFFSKGLVHNPENASARTSYARTLYLNGNAAEARRQLELANEYKPDRPITLFLLAQLDEEAGNDELAARRYQRIIELKPNHEGAHFYLGNYFLRKQRYEEAIEHYDASIDGGNKGAVAQVLRLVARLLQDAPAPQAYEYITETNQKLGGIYTLTRLEVLMLALNDNNGLRNVEKARSIAEKFSAGSPTPGAIELLAIVSAAEGDYETASKHISRVNTMLMQAGRPQRRSRYTLAFSKHQLPPLDLERELLRIIPYKANPVTAFRDYPDPRPVM